VTAHLVPSQLSVLLEFLLFLDDQEFRVRCVFPLFHIPPVCLFLLMSLYELLYEFLLCLVMNPCYPLMF